jgi:hypothetical protein
MSKTTFPGTARCAIDKTPQSFASKYPGSVIKPEVFLVHSTEGYGWPGYSGGATAPNATLMPDFANKRVLIRQHFPANRSARALENRAGGVETNTAGTFQVELVGTCDPRTHAAWAAKGIKHIYMPDPPQWFIDGVADVLAWLNDEWDTKIQDAAPRGWGAYPSSYGSSRYRLSFAEWKAAYGVLGHQHVPENSHGDPGAFPVAKLIAAAKGTTPVPTKPTSNTVRHFGHRHLNTWGDDGAKGTASFYDRVDEMVADLVSGTKPEVITLNEVRDEHVPSWRKRLGQHDYDVVLAKAGNLVAIPTGSEVRKAQSKYLPGSVQGKGRREALGMVRAKINGHWTHIFVSHLDYRDGAKFDAIRVKQAAWIADEEKRWADVFDLADWEKHTTLGIDENSHTWVRDKAFSPAGLKVAGKSGIDAVYGNRATSTSRTIKTASDHPIIDVVYTKTVAK